MRSTSFLLLSGAAWGLVNAAPVASNVLGGLTPRSSSTRWESDRMTGATLQSLRILPDDDNDGILDVAGSLKMLGENDPLDIGGVVRVGGLLDACFEIVVDGVPTKRCHDGKGRGRKHRNQQLSSDGWTKQEHRECAKHFKSWHKQHGSRSCSDRLRDAEKKIRELEKRLNECQPNSDYRPYHPVNNIKTGRPSHSDDSNDNDKSTDNWTAPKSTWSGDDSNSNSSPDNNWKPETQPGQQWRDETKGGCKNGVYTYTDKDGIHVRACISADVNAGPVHAHADAEAKVDADLKKGKVDAKAKADATVGVDGVATATLKATATASVDLKKGQADVHVKTDDALKVGDTQVIKTGLDAQVKVNKPCSGVVNAAGICVELSSDKDDGNHSGQLLGNVLGGNRVL